MALFTKLADWDGRGVQFLLLGTKHLILTSRQVSQYCELEPASKQLLRAGVESLGLPARSHDKILRVARTIADIAGSETIGEEHLAEAISYRNLDADLWV